MTTMLDCKKIQPALSEFLDGTLPESQAFEIRRHLGSCAVCEKVVEELASTVRLVATLPSVAPSENFDDKLAARLANLVLTPRPETLSEKLGAWWGRPRVRPAVASGFALVALAPVCFFLLRPTPKPAPLADSGDAVLAQIAREHTDYAASGPLSDPGDSLETGTL